jgi:hypothetical protein
VVQDPAALKASKFASSESWAFMDDPGHARESIEEFIDRAHRLVLEILLSWPSVAQAEVVLPGSGRAQ